MAKFQDFTPDFGLSRRTDGEETPAPWHGTPTDLNLFDLLYASTLTLAACRQPTGRIGESCQLGRLLRLPWGDEADQRVPFSRDGLLYNLHHHHLRGSLPLRLVCLFTSPLVISSRVACIDGRRA